ncbi:MAG TPA: FHA domain-containing protein [Pyrinomonadaceae bacterium]|nr:FHA domain-containing protein [Pyrinomonadaceae bacterium]
MKIILAEERSGGALSPERTFDQGVIRIGRDTESDLVYEGAAYPMVSRKHAELRLHDGRWALVDLNSSYGSYVNGQRITTPTFVSAGSRLQFGESGPVIQVVWFEVATESVMSSQPQSVVGAPPQQDPQKPQPKHATAMKTPIVSLPSHQAASAKPQAASRLEFKGSDPRPPVQLGQNTIWLGREPSCDITFNASDIMVSRKHAAIRLQDSGYVVEDNNSFNGTLVNEQRISAPTPLFDSDEIRLGIGGPVLRLVSPSRIAPRGASLAGQRSVLLGQIPSLVGADAAAFSKTMVAKLDTGQLNLPGNDTEPQLLMSVTFGDKKELAIGRDDRNDIKLDGLQISNRHARLIRSGDSVVVDDLNSTNGVYLNGTRVSRTAIQPGDSVSIGSFVIQVDQGGNIGVFDTRAKTRIDAVGLTKEVKSRLGGGRIRLLDGISLSIKPNEFVGFLGPSGAGKTTLMDAMNGMRPAQSGNVLINNLDLYRHLDSLKQAIGYVPQDDIIHRELTVYRTLYYVAKLRLSRDVSREEINRSIEEVLDVTGLTERRNVPINQLSGGQRKRVSIAVELITKPSVIFLDEPTSGLDPGTEERIMKLFRQIAESGRTVIMTTHAMENVKLFDKIVVMMRGKLVFYGAPDDALKYLNAKSFKGLFDKLEKPVEELIHEHGETNRHSITDKVAEDWKQKFLNTPQYKQNVYEPLKQLGEMAAAGRQKKRRLGIVGAIRQWLTLSRRYLEVLFKDKLNLFILFAQAPAIAVMTFLVMGNDSPRDFVYFVISLVAIWFGTSVSAREIIRERPVYRRERMVNLGILPYVGSKLFVIGIIVGVQCLMLFVPLKLFDLVGLMPMPGEKGGLPQFSVMLLTAAVGVSLGLLISALVRTSQMATSLVPLVLIPQILFSGLVGVPTGIYKVATLAVPAAWSFDTMKRYSTLDTLEEDGAEPNGASGGLGLYKYTETENDKIIANARKSLDDYQNDVRKKFEQYQDQVRNGQNPPPPSPDEPPAIPAAKKIPHDLSHYITFLHPWMNEVLTQVVLMLMFGMMVIITLIVLRLQDIG